MAVTADEATTKAMLDAFAACQAECQSIQNAVDSARSQLAAEWQSDTAAPRFLAAVDEWVAGFQRVRHGLNALDQSMKGYAHLTDSTEDANWSLSQGLTS